MQNVRRRVEVGQKPLTIRKTLNPTKQNPMTLKVVPLHFAVGLEHTA